MTVHSVAAVGLLQNVRFLHPEHLPHAISTTRCWQLRMINYTKTISKYAKQTESPKSPLIICCQYLLWWKHHCVIQIEICTLTSTIIIKTRNFHSGDLEFNINWYQYIIHQMFRCQLRHQAKTVSRKSILTGQHIQTLARQTANKCQKTLPF